MQTIQWDAMVSDTIAAGENKEYELQLTESGKFVVETGGNANILFGIWVREFSTATGMLRICGVARRGCRMLKPGKHVIRVTGNTAGAFTFVIRHWSFFDYFTINSKSNKSTC